MRDMFKIELGTRKYMFQLEIRRNITVLLGDSGVGKTAFCNMLNLYLRHEKAISLNIESKYGTQVALKILSDFENALTIVHNAHNTIFFIDEDVFSAIPNASDIIHNTSNYFVILSRRVTGLNSLPISYSEVYTLTITHSGQRSIIRNTNYFINKLQAVGMQSSYTTMLVEDAKSGYFFLKRNIKDKEIITAKGKDNIGNTIEENNLRRKTCLVVADGAAIGVTLYSLYNSDKLSDSVYFWLPESFEWFLLHNSVFRQYFKVQNLNGKPALNELRTLLTTKTVQVDSAKHISWERYFTDLMERCCKEIDYTYDKGRLPKFLKDEQVVNDLLQQLPFKV